MLRTVAHIGYFKMFVVCMKWNMWRETDQPVSIYYNMMFVSILIMMQWGEWAETQSNLQMCLNNPLTDSNLVK